MMSAHKLLSGLINYKDDENHLKDMLERTAWTFIEAFIGALTVAPLVGVDAEIVQLAALAGGGAALAVVKTYAKKQIGGGSQTVSK